MTSFKIRQTWNSFSKPVEIFPHHYPEISERITSASQLETYFSIKVQYLKIQQVIRNMIYKASIHLITICISYQCYTPSFFSTFFCGGNKMDSFLGSFSEGFCGTAAFPRITAITSIKGKINNWLFCNFYTAHKLFHICEILTLVSSQEFFHWLQLDQQFTNVLIVS